MEIEKIKNSMPDTRQLDSLTELFKVLGDVTRAKILYSIENCELCVNDICECVGLNKSAVSHQLKVLKDAHLVRSRKDGKEVYYTVDDEHVELIFKCALEHINEKK